MLQKHYFSMRDEGQNIEIGNPFLLRDKLQDQINMTSISQIASVKGFDTVFILAFRHRQFQLKTYTASQQYHKQFEGDNNPIEKDEFDKETITQLLNLKSRKINYIQQFYKNDFKNDGVIKSYQI
ncbi:unnamed protein product [Paramecium sonneborni]|uniref:Uncharacterized protein n=1 Tax=Paramecium sonneborni TaxID=65129 RepID=A0A8S1NTF8_9CILI|nr:unnamed protein product [Paramecium sonneborni]